MIPQILAQVGNGPRNPQATFLVVAMLVIAATMLASCLILARYFNVWVQARMSGTVVSIWDLISMSIRGINPDVIVRTKIMALQAGLSDADGVTIANLQRHHLAGGDVANLVRELIASRRVGLPITFEQAAAIDQAGRVLRKVPATDPFGDIDAARADHLRQFGNRQNTL